MAIATPVVVGEWSTAQGTNSSVGGTTTASVAVGDLLILVIGGGSITAGQRFDMTGESISFGTNSFSSVLSQPQAANSQAGVFVRRCVATEAESSGTTLTASFTSVSGCSAHAALYKITSGFNSSTPIDASGSTASTSSTGWTATTAAAITDGNDLVMAGSWNISSGTKTSTPGNIDGSAATELSDFTSAGGRSMTVEYRLLSGASLATKTGAGTWSGTAAHHADFVIAVLPAAGNVSVSAGVANATASGLASSTLVSVSSVVASATAAGLVSTVSVDLPASVASATASGVASSSTITVPLSVAVATGAGLVSTPAVSVSLAVASATAAGVAPSAVVVSVAPPTAAAVATALAPTNFVDESDVPHDANARKSVDQWTASVFHHGRRRR